MKIVLRILLILQILTKFQVLEAVEEQFNKYKI